LSTEATVALAVFVKCQLFVAKLGW